MSAIYDAYKPLRNYLRHCALEPTLEDVWQLSLHAAKPATFSGRALAAELSYPLDGQPIPPELPTIALEVLLHARKRGGTKRLNSLTAVGKVVSSLRNIVNEGSKLRLTGEDDIFDEMLRISHHQFPWQNRDFYTSMIRCFKTFSAPSLAPIFEKRTGLSVREFYFLGLALGADLRSRFVINSAQDYSEFGISNEKTTAFFTRLSTSIDELRRLYAQQPVDATWDYRSNPLVEKPLVATDPEHPNRLLCPVPEFLLRRFSSGLYYDLVNDSKFGSAFGAAFEAYIGEVLMVAFKDGPTIVLEETPYTVKGEVHHGPDWIVCDAGSNLVIECKGKRLPHTARVAGKSELAGEIDKIAKAVVQNYKNIREAQQGLSSWKPNDHPIVPLVITFEDWFFLGQPLYEQLEASVRRQLIDACVDVTLIETMPYAVMSCREFEMCIGAMREGGIAKFFEGKREGEYLHWMWPQYLQREYKNIEPINFQKAFEPVWRTIIAGS